MSIDRGVDQEDVVHIHNGILLSHKKDEIMPFAATWMELETLILREVSRKEKDKYPMISHIWNLIYTANEPFHRKENHGHGEQTWGCQDRWRGNGMVLQYEVNRFKLLHLEWISMEILLYSTENYI